MDEAPDGYYQSLSFTDSILPCLGPVCALHPSTVTISPIFKVFRVHPMRVSAPGLPISKVQCAIWPVSSFPSICNDACGFIHSTELTVPVTVTGFVQSCSAANG